MLLDHHVIEANEDWEGCKDWEEYKAKTDARIRALWKPLPLDHPRTRAWIRDSYRHLAHCYEDKERPEYGRPGTLIYPVPDYKLKRPLIDPHWTEEYKQAVTAEADAFNAQEISRARGIATPENHCAVVKIRRFYPGYEPETSLIDAPPKTVKGNWWETDAEKPTPEACKPRGGKHPMNISWCQWCGWKEATS